MPQYCDGADFNYFNLTPDDEIFNSETYVVFLSVWICMTGIEPHYVY